MRWVRASGGRLGAYVSRLRARLETFAGARLELENPCDLPQGSLLRGRGAHSARLRRPTLYPMSYGRAASCSRRA